MKGKKSGNIFMKLLFYFFMITLATIDTTKWVFDTSSSFNICNMLRGLRISRWLNKEEVNLHVANGANVAAIAVGEISLVMPMGKTMLLESCYYVPKFVSNIISILSLDKYGFRTTFHNNQCVIFHGDELYVHCYLQHGLYVFT
ncbi:hypothetical protein RND81_03G009000 [Saponaria officinalis]|uniref:Retrovirus-related Pol polyprotein from transposon TNT 1-94-like beta-barrel domain-containing protein n=1 Tax=Saponaria officinalis TaxID=3572 RepID=A0AAW1M4D5_SAPOF